MTNKIHWIHWPHNINYAWPSWYNFIRRLLVIIPYYSGIYLATISVFIGYGFEEAKSFWRDI